MIRIYWLQFLTWKVFLYSVYVYIGIIILEMQLIETLNLYKVSLELSEAGEGKVMEQSTRRIVET